MEPPLINEGRPTRTRNVDGWYGGPRTRIGSFLRKHGPVFVSTLPYVLRVNQESEASCHFVMGLHTMTELKGRGSSTGPSGLVAFEIFGTTTTKIFVSICTDTKILVSICTDTVYLPIELRTYL